MANPRQTDLFLEHYGVKGMKWGIRKSRSGSSGSGWTVHPDGAIEIDQTATLSRVVRNHSGLFGGKGATIDGGRPLYAAFKPYDVTGYEHGFGRSKSLLVKDASVVQKLTPKTTLKAPGPKEAAALYFSTAKSDPETLAALRSNLHGFARAGLDKALADPTSQKAYEIYSLALDSANYNEKYRFINEKYFAAVKRAGYNMLLDPSDALSDFDAPVMILDAHKNLSLSAQTIVDKASQEKARLLYKELATKRGKTYLESLGYL